MPCRVTMPEHRPERLRSGRLQGMCKSIVARIERPQRSFGRRQVRVSLVGLKFIDFKSRPFAAASCSLGCFYSNPRKDIPLRSLRLLPLWRSLYARHCRHAASNDPMRLLSPVFPAFSPSAPSVVGRIDERIRCLARIAFMATYVQAIPSSEIDNVRNLSHIQDWRLLLE